MSSEDFIEVAAAQNNAPATVTVTITRDELIAIGFATALLAAQSHKSPRHAHHAAILVGMVDRLTFPEQNLPQ